MPPQSAITVKDVLTDPKFQSMSPEQKRATLARIDPDFAKLSPEQQQAIVSRKWEAQPKTETPPPDTGRSALDYITEPITGFGRGLKGALVDLPATYLETFFQPGKYPAGFAGRVIGETTEGLRRGYAARQQARQSGEGIPGQILATMENYPLGIGAATRRVEQGGPHMFSPESLGVAGEGAGFMLAPEIAGKAVSGARIAEQERLGAGKVPVLHKEAARAGELKAIAERYKEDVTKSEMGHAEDVTKHEKRVDEIKQAHAEKVKEAQEKYQRELADYRKKASEGKQAHAEKVVQARKEWVERTHEARKSVAEAERVKNRSQVLGRSAEAYLERIKNNLKQTHQTVRGQLDSRWNSLREKIGKDTPVNASKVYDSIEQARKEFLRGSPQNLQVFNSLVKEMGLDLIEGEKGELSASPGQTMDWQTARTHYSAVGDALSAGNLPGNVYQALKYVKEKGLDPVLEDTAKQKGMGQEYSALKRDWRNYENDWRDMGAMGTGGSPLARALRSPDAKSVGQLLSGKYGDRFLETYARYKGAGASTDLMSGYRGVTEQAKALTRPKALSDPGKFEEPKPPRVPEQPVGPEVVKQPKLPEAPQKRPVDVPKSPAQVNPADVRLKIIENYAARPYRWFEFMPPFLGERMLLSSPAFREFIARQPRNELATRYGINPKAQFRPPSPMGPESDIEMARRRGPGGGPGEQNAIWQGVVDNLRAKLARQRAAGDPLANLTQDKLSEAEKTLKSTFGSEKYATSPQGFSSTGGGGANYSPSDLDDLKKRYGIQ